MDQRAILENAAERPVARSLPKQRFKLQLPALDPKLLRSHFLSAGLCHSLASDESVAALYYQRRECRTFSANPYFDELWYRAQNRDVCSAIEAGDPLSGFAHFVLFGIYEGRW